jgi:hypothetical protein
VPGPVSISIEDPPGFATLNGQLLTLSPTRADQGDYPIALVAESGGEKASTTLTVTVVRPNSAPSPVSLHLSDAGIHDLATCPGNWCTAIGTPYVGVGTDDRDGDAVTIDLEVVRRGEPFSGKPTYSQTLPGSKRFQQSAVFTLDGLAPGQSYLLAVRACDQFRMCANPPESITGVGGPDDQGVALAEGWVTAPKLGFDQGACAGAQCACKPSGMFSAFKDDCCSGAIVPVPPSPMFPNGSSVCQ